LVVYFFQYLTEFFENNIKEKKNNFTEFMQGISSLLTSQEFIFHPKNFQEHDTLNDFLTQNLIIPKIYSIWHDYDDITLKNLLILLQESIWMCSLFLGKQIPIHFTWMAVNRTVFLSLYYLEFQKFVNPFYQLFASDSESRKILDSEKVEFCINWDDGRFSALFKLFDYDFRNKIAHRNYNPKEKGKSFRFMVAQMKTFYQIEREFFPNIERVPLEGGIGELWYFWFSIPYYEWKNTVFQKMETLTEFSDFPAINEVNCTIFAVCSYIESQNGKEYALKLVKINQNLDKMEKNERNYFWCLILYWFDFQNKKNTFSPKVIEIFYKHIHAMPDSFLRIGQ
jgi:hypothetical protein